MATDSYQTYVDEITKVITTLGETQVSPERERMINAARDLLIEARTLLEVYRLQPRILKDASLVIRASTIVDVVRRLLYPK